MRKSLLVLAAAALAGSAAADVQLIARLVPGADAHAVAKSHRLTYKDQTDDGPFALFSARTATEGDKAQAELASDPLVVWAEDDDQVSSPEGGKQAAAITPTKGSVLPVVGDRKALYPFNANAFTAVGWSQTLAEAPGRTVRLAILDTGLGQKQTGMWAKVDASANFVERGKPAYDRNSSTDSNGDGVMDSATGHGTFVAGIVDQIAPQARLVIARISDSDGTATVWALVKGISFAAAQHCEVANISLGTLNNLPAINDVLDYAEEKGVQVVAAMGNDGMRAACYPARSSKAIAVAGLMPDLTRAPFSNWEGTCDASAPATGILSQWWDGRTATWSGTSFSTPIVAALLSDAARRSSTPVLPRKLRDALQKAGTRPDRQNPNNKGELGVVPDHARLVGQIR